MLETLSDATPGPESFTGSANSPEAETDLILGPEDVSDQLQPTPADSDGPDADTEVEPADLCNDPSPGLPETSTGSRSLVPLPRRGTQLLYGCF